MVGARHPDSVREINEQHALTLYLPEVALPPSLRASSDFEQLLAHACQQDDAPGMIILGVPFAGLEEGCQKLAQHLPAQRRHPLYIIRTSNGFDPHTGQLPNAITARQLPRHSWLHTGSLSGPSFALQLAQGLPVALTIATPSKPLAPACFEVLHGIQARIYHNEDVLGAENGEARTNIIAVA